jgi:hypothetical protein
MGEKQMAEKTTTKPNEQTEATRMTIKKAAAVMQQLRLFDEALLEAQRDQESSRSKTASDALRKPRRLPADATTEETELQEKRTLRLPNEATGQRQLP